LSKTAGTEPVVIVNGLLNPAEGALIVSSAVDERSISLDDDLSNGFDH